MSRIEQLIQQYCPNGVEYKALGEVTNYEQPTKYLVKSSNYRDDFSIPVLTAGKTFILGYTDEQSGIYYASNKPVIIFDDFTTANKWVNFNFKVKSSAMKMITSKNNKKYILKYVYYWLNTLPCDVVDGDHKRHWISDFTIKLIPIPPIPVQEEIVRILDKFTTLEAELEAELDCRKRQYEYYRNKLLTFSQMGGVKHIEWSTLGAEGSFISGLSGKTKQNFINGNCRYISYVNVYSNLSVDLNKKDFVQIKDGEKQNSVMLGDVIFTGSSETPDECALSSVITEEPMENIYLNSFCFIWRPTDKDKFDANYLKHLFRSQQLRKQLIKTSSGVTRFNVSKKKMELVKFPIPSIETQKHVAEILDKFFYYCEDLTNGLPAEIDARRKQYEYYRNKLLSFSRA